MPDQEPCPRREANDRGCSCPNRECPRHGLCCACVRNHLAGGSLPMCLRNLEKS